MKWFWIRAAVLTAALLGIGFGDDAMGQLTNPADILPLPEVSETSGHKSQRGDRPQALDASPETLDDAWQAALACDQRLAAGNFNVSAASHARSAACSERLPSLTLGANYLRLSDEIAFSPKAPSVGGLPLFGQDSLGFHALIRQPIYTSGRISSGIEAADAGVSETSSELDRDTLDLKMYVAEAYVAVLRCRRMVEVANSKLTSLTAHAADVETRFQKDKASRNELLTVRVALADAEQQMVRAENNLAMVQAAYNRVLGRALAAPVNITDLDVSLDLGNLDDLTATAKKFRPELAELSARAALFRAQANATRAASSPQLGIQGGYIFQGDRFLEPNGAAVLALTAEWGFFDSGRTSNQATALCEKAEAITRVQKDMETSIALEVRQRWLELQTAKQQIIFARTAIAQADENLRSVRERYTQNMANSTEVLDAQALQVQASTNLYDSTYDAVLASLRLKRATGKF